MDFIFSNASLEQAKADIIVVSCFQKTKDKNDKGIAVLQNSDGGMALDKKLGGLLSRIIKEEEFRGELGSTRLIYSGGKIPAKAVLLVGLGKHIEINLDVYRKMGAKVYSEASAIKAKNLSLVLQSESVKNFPSYERLKTFVEGVVLGSYKFENYKDKKDVEKETLEQIIFIAKKSDKLEDAVKEGNLMGESVNFVRDLVNMPSSDMTPSDLAVAALKIAKEQKLSCKVLGINEIKKEKMGLLLGVARGSHNEPKFIHLTYKPTGKVKINVALVGKGVTFDTGGYDLKPTKAMDHMKCDMAGAATCLAVIKIASALKLPIGVDVYIPATDNMVDAKAEVPGNILRARNGKTVEICNMDAEGRLILADAISYALDKKPDIIIDAATLTGHVLYSLGEIYTAVLGNEQKLVDKYLSASREECEPSWQMPLEKEYKKPLTDSIADLKNEPKTRAGTIGAALFLQEFVGETKWLHLDIAESAWTDEPRDYTPKGGTGATVRSLVRLLRAIPHNP